MKTKILVIILFSFTLLLGSVKVSASSGILLEYEIEGSAVGGTTLLGNLKIIMQNQIKRLTGNLFYDEPGSPYPTLKEKDLIVNYTDKTKALKTTDTGSWSTDPLSDDFSMIKDNELSVTLKSGSSSSSVTAVVKISLPADFGGEKIYVIKLNYADTDSNLFSEFQYPTGLDFLGIYLDNEKVVDSLNKKLSAYKLKIPKSFTIVAQQKGKDFLNITGQLRSKMGMGLPKNAFSMK